VLLQMFDDVLLQMVGDVLLQLFDDVLLQWADHLELVFLLFMGLLVERKETHHGIGWVS
jgi:hypothetical protein